VNDQSENGQYDTLMNLVGFTCSRHFDEFMLEFHETELSDQDYQNKCGVLNLRLDERDDTLIESADWDTLCTIFTYYIRAAHWLWEDLDVFIANKRYLKVMLRLQELFNTNVSDNTRR